MTIEYIKNILSPVFERSGNIRFVYLFGSVARGEAALLSDIDIAVYLNHVHPADSFDARLSLHAGICRALKRDDVDLVVLNTLSNTMLAEDIIRHGIVIYDRDAATREEFEIRALHKAIDFKTQRLAVMGI